MARQPMLSVRQLEVFRAVIVSGSISAASARLGVAQPTVTNTIRRLEDVLGVSLFTRQGGRLVPTRMAQQIFEVVNPSIAGLEQLSEQVREVAQGRHATLRLGVSPSVSQALGPKTLALFAADFPDVRLRMDTLSLKQVRDYLWLAEGDCAMTIFPVDEPMIVSHRISEIGMVCLVPADHPLAARESVAIEDIAAERLIFFHPNTPHGKLVRRMFEARGIEPDIAIETRFAETAANLMHEGFGIALSDALTAKGLREPGVAVRPLKDSPRQPVLLHYHQATGQRAELAALRDAALRAAAALGLPAYAAA